MIHTITIDAYNKTKSNFKKLPLIKCEDDELSACIPTNISYFVRGRVDFNDLVCR